MVVLHALDSVRDEFHPVVVHDRPEHLPPASTPSGRWEVLPYGPPTLRLRLRATTVRILGEARTIRIGRLARRLTRLTRGEATSQALEALPHPRPGTAA